MSRGHGFRWGESGNPLVTRAVCVFTVCMNLAGNSLESEVWSLRACLKIARGAAARDFGFGQGGEEGASPQWAVTTEPTPAKDKRPAARRVFAQQAVWLRCSSVEDPQGVWASQALRVRFPKLGGAISRTAVSFVAPPACKTYGLEAPPACRTYGLRLGDYGSERLEAPRHPAFCAKTPPLEIFRQALWSGDASLGFQTPASRRGTPDSRLKETL